MRRFSVIASVFSLSLSLVGCGKGMQAANGSAANPSSPLAPLVAGPQVTFGALGDSITRGFDIDGLGQESVTKNWSSGSALPSSHLNLITGLFAQQNVTITPVVVNNAVTGETVLGSNSAFQSKATDLAAANVDYATLLIGANDVCQGLVNTPAAQATFQADIQTALEKLVNAPHPPKVIAVASIPHIWNLTQIPGLANNTTCVDLWKLLCPNLSVGQATFESQWTAANQAIANAAAAVGGPVIYDGGAVASYAFVQSEVSALDCFHPSVSGQTAIATTVWPKVQGAVQSLLINP